MTQYTRELTVKNYDEFLEKLPNSGVFDMLDCAVEIYCPEMAEAVEVERMVNLVESMIHVTDVKVGSDIRDFASGSTSYRILITEISDKLTKRYKRDSK